MRRSRARRSWKRGDTSTQNVHSFTRAYTPLAEDFIPNIKPCQRKLLKIPGLFEDLRNKYPSLDVRLDEEETTARVRASEGILKKAFADVLSRVTSIREVKIKLSPAVLNMYVKENTREWIQKVLDYRQMICHWEVCEGHLLLSGLSYELVRLSQIFEQTFTAVFIDLDLQQARILQSMAWQKFKEQVENEKGPLGDPSPILIPTPETKQIIVVDSPSNINNTHKKINEFFQEKHQGITTPAAAVAPGSNTCDRSLESSGESSSETRQNSEERPLQSPDEGRIGNAHTPESRQRGIRRSANNSPALDTARASTTTLPTVNPEERPQRLGNEEERSGNTRSRVTGGTVLPVQHVQTVTTATQTPDTQTQEQVTREEFVQIKEQLDTLREFVRQSMASMTQQQQQSQRQTEQALEEMRIRMQYAQMGESQVNAFRMNSMENRLLQHIQPGNTVPPYQDADVADFQEAVGLDVCNASVSDDTAASELSEH